MGMNLIDNMLDDRPLGPKTASSDLGDSLMDCLTRSPQYGRGGAHKAAAEDSLAEAGMRIVASRKRESVRSIEAALKLAAELPAQYEKAPQNVKAASKGAGRRIAEAAARLNRIASKTSAQMRQDGASRLADYLDPAVVPSWAKQAQADVNLIFHMASRLAPSSRKASAEEIIAERSLSDKEIGKYIEDLLNGGYTPKEVDSKLRKLAELQLFDRYFATDKLRNDAGLVGYSFLEPNSFMDSCSSTYQRMNTKLGGVRAHSVKQIAACTGCQHFKQASAEKRCTLYRLPIVASQKDLLPIINNLTPGVKGAAAKKAALVAQHNRETSRPVVAVKKATREARFARTTEDVSICTGFASRTSSTPSSEFTAADALQMHQAGQSLRSIYTKAAASVGGQQAKAEVRKFIAGLKGSKTKVALSQIDCSLLKGKLATSNAIIGEPKCASCTYRTGMHCGLTGGTLLTFPGLDKVSSKHRTAAGSPKDGLGMLREFGLTAGTRAEDITFSSPSSDDVELTGTSKVDL